MVAVALGWVLAACGTLTEMARLWIRGAVAMKMIKSTKITSTKGAILMPEMDSCEVSEVCTLSAPLVFELGQEKPGHGVGIHEDVLDQLLENIISHHAGDRDDEARGRGDQSLGEALHHHFRAPASGQREVAIPCVVAYNV